MTHFLVHGKDDTVGVAVVDVKAGQKLTGWNMEAQQELNVEAKADIPLGHKIAIKDVAAGELIIKYDQPIGKLSQPVNKGEHVHTHNLKTRRW